MKSEEEFDDFLKDKLSESSGHYSPENWERMQVLLNASHGAKGAFIWSRLNNMVAVVGVGVGAFVGSHLFFPENTGTPLDFTKISSKEIPANNEIALQENNINMVKDNSLLLSGSNGIALNNSNTENTNKGLSTNKGGTTSLSNKQTSSTLAGNNNNGFSVVAENNKNNNTAFTNNMLQNAAGTISSIQAGSAETADQSNVQSDLMEPAKEANVAMEKTMTENPEAENAAANNVEESATTIHAQQNSVEAISPASYALMEVENMAAEIHANKGTIIAEESAPSNIDPIITANKVMPVNYGFELGSQLWSNWGNAEYPLLPVNGISLGSNVRINVKPTLQLTGDFSIAYRKGIELGKTSYIYYYDFNLTRIPISVVVNGMTLTTLMVGARQSLGKFGNLQATLGAQFMIDTKSEINANMVPDSIYFDRGKWGYRTGLKKWDILAGIGYDYPISQRMELFGLYRFGFNKDNTDNLYFESTAKDVNRYFQFGFRYFIKPNQPHVEERFK